MQRSIVKLGEVVQSISKTFKFTSAPVVFLNTSDVLNGKVLNHELISPVGLPGQAKKTIQTHDILFSEIRPANRRFAYVDFEANNFVVSTKLMVLRCNERICPKYLYFYLTSNEMLAYLQQQAEGRSGTFPQITFDELRHLEISLPPLAEQRQIAAILSSLDDKIELNRRMNQTLEQLAQTLFRQWFVAFDFPDAAGQPYRSSGGELVESELGKIPRGWRVGKTQEAFSTVGGGTPSTSNAEFWDGGNIHWTTPKDLTGAATPVMLDTERRITKAGLGKISSGLLPTGTLLLSSRAPIGYLAITQLPVAINQGYIALNAKGTISNLYMLFWLKQHMETVKGRANGTTFQEISKGSFRDISMILPDTSTATKFNLIIQPLFDRIVANETQSRTLATLRDTLLPQLLSGRLTVRQAAEAVA